jgi:hypothetical protein
MQARPVVGVVIMPGRLRTASRPFSTLIDSAPYSAAASALRFEAGVMVPWGSFWVF